jgi:UDP-N-acetyl-D-glucosamine dehydrogenase
MQNPLSQKITDRTAVVGVIGLGYVGLPLGRAFHDAGFHVLGFDVDPKKIDHLKSGANYLMHLGEDFVRAMAQSGRFEATTDFGRLTEADAILVCVPTPLGDHLEPDLSFVESSTDAIAACLRAGQLVVLESTTFPGTTRDTMCPRLCRGGLRCGDDFFLAYSPEREDPGRRDHSTQTIPKLVGGIDAVSGEVARQLYAAACEQVILVRNAEIAEAAKLLENIYRSVNIALVNEMKVLLTEMGVDVWEVIDAAATKPFGFQAFYPGPGLGGHCIPIDPYYLSWKAREAGLTTRFIELAGEINRAMPTYVIQRISMALNDHGKPIRGSRILILGLAYKPDVDDVRESPSLELIVQLRKLGADVDYNDPHVAATHKMRNYDLGMTSTPLTSESLGAYDCVVVATHHAAYDWQHIADHARLVVDCRGAMRRVSGDHRHLYPA